MTKSKVYISKRQTSPHVPHAFVLHHGHEHLLAGAVAIDKEQEGVGHVLGRIGLGTHHAHLFQATAGLLLLAHEHLHVGYELLAVALGNGLGTVAAIDKLLVLALKEQVVIGLGSLAGHFVGRGPAVAAAPAQGTTTDKE